MNGRDVEVEVQDARTGARRVVRSSAQTLLAGRDPDSDVVLASPFVSYRQLRLTVGDGEVYIDNIGWTPCRVAGVDVARGASAAVRPGDEIRIAEFSLRLLPPEQPGDTIPTPRQTRFAILSALHTELVHRLEVSGRPGGTAFDDGIRKQVQTQIDVLVEACIAETPAPAFAQLAAAALWERLVRAPAAAAPDSDADPFEREVTVLLQGLDDVRGLAAQAQDAAVSHSLARAVAGADRAVLMHAVRSDLRAELRALVFGFGPLESLLRRQDVVEIMVVGKDRIYLERGGRLELAGLRFMSEANLLDVIQRMVAPLGRRIDRSSPMVDGRLPSGARINAVIAPVAVQGPQLTIRKFPTHPLTIDDLIEKGALDDHAAAFLRACVRARRNLLVAGGTASGKTTLLNVLTAFVGAGERIVTVEDAAELRLQQDHVVTLETRPPNLEGRGEITIRDLVRNALRMRPDRIIVGECRGTEAADMLQAMNTGHGGSMTTIHANSAADAISRLEVMVLGSLDVPLRAVRESIASAVDIIVHVARDRNGRRAVRQISEVVAFDADAGEVVVADLYRCDERGPLASTGRLASFAAELVEGGHLAVGDLFA
jgi:pilus assembly protein CpaF